MLVGRKQEAARVDRLLEGARSGANGVLVIEGEPGIGKTALLDRARRRASGLTILETSGHELEAELPFAGLSRLVAPIVELRAGLAEPQRHALEGALALRTLEQLDRFAVYAAVLHLIAAAAEREPLLVVVDDAQWLDRSSADACGFVARRLDAEAVALLVATRPPTDGNPFTRSVDQHLRLTGIGVTDARALLARHGRPVDEATAQHLVAGTGGNPLALTEVAAQLSAGQREGREPLPDPLPAVSSAAAIFGPRLARLDEDIRTALTVVAASGSGALSEVVPAFPALGLEHDALVAAGDTGLVSLDDAHARFCHPLARSLAYHSAPVSRRRAAHRALAEATRTTGSPGRSTWHQAAAALGPDGAVAEELTHLAADARARGAPVAAGRAMERAAQLTRAAEDGALRLLAAAADFHIGGRPEQALSAIAATLDLTSSATVRADAHRLKALVDAARRPPDDVLRELLAEADRVEPHDALRAAHMRVEAAWVTMFTARLPDALALARRAHAVCERAGGAPALEANLTLSAVLNLTGAADEANRRLRDAEPLLDRMDALAAPYTVASVAYGYMVTGDLVRASRALRDLIGRCRSSGAVTVLPYALALLADVELRLGDWDRAYAAGSEAVVLTEDLDQPGELAHSLVRLADVEAGQGRERECRAHLDRARRIARANGTRALVAMAARVEGFLELGLGRFAEAVAPLEQAHSMLQAAGHGEPFLVPCAPDLVEAYARLERVDEARAVLAVLEDHARSTGRPVNQAYAARSRALLASDADAERHFEAALRHHAEGPAVPFEHARTQLCRGERLRRAGRRVDARAPLREAEYTFEGLGARGWLERARSELAATGQRARRRQPSTRGELTPQELQVALEVADGATNREVAAALFLSTKTVEAHLSRAYRKLGVRSRAELTAALLRRPPEATISPD
jgi:DNA-binding NarL/FixJ family response regulator